MSKQRLIRSLNFDSTRFQHRFRQFDQAVLKEARRTLGDLTLIDIDKPPARLHLHALAGKQVDSALDPRKKK